MKPVALKTASVAGVTFQGATVKDAKETGEKEIARFVTEAKFGPSLYRVEGLKDEFLEILIWPEIEGWAYRILDGSPRQSSGAYGFIHPTCNFNATSRAAACADALYAAAQRLWSLEVTDDEAFFVRCFGRLLESTGSYQKIRDLRDHANWQRRYAVAFSICGDKTMSHNNASRTSTIEACEALCRKELGMRIAS